MAAIRESIARGYNGRTITIFTDSQAALKALESVTVKSKLVLECLNELATQFNWCGCRDMKASWALRGLTSPYLAYRIAWSSEQSGNGWRGNT